MSLLRRRHHHSGANVTTVYPASKAKWKNWWRALAAAGVPIAAGWPWAAINTVPDHPPSPAQWSSHWTECLQSASEADICLFVCNEGEVACGQLLEAGAALSAGKEVWIVSDYWFSFSHLPNCRTFASLEDAIAAIMARKQGEASRNEIERRRA
jgi:hypothetical protein